MSSVISWLFGAGGVGAAATLDPARDEYYNILSPGSRSRTGVYVSPDTSRNIATVYRCVAILANLLAMFPKGIYEKLPVGRREAPDHPLDPLISFRPNRRQTAFEFWRQLAHHLVLRQNAFVQIVQGGVGAAWVGELVPLHPDRVSGPEELADGRLRYEYVRKDGRKFVLIGGEDMWHIPGLSEDGLRGLSMVDLARDSFGGAIAAERHAAQTWKSGIKIAGVLQSDKALKPDVAEAMGDSFGRRWGGEAGIGGVPVLWDGVTFQPVEMSSKDAEFLDSRKFSVSEIARWFGVPPHLVGDVERSTSWGTGIAEQNLAFLIYSIQPYIELLQQSIRFNLIVQSRRFYAKFNPGALLQMAPEKQAEVFAKLIEKGVYNPNEVRELLERNPRKGGDEYVNPAQNVARPAGDMAGGSGGGGSSDQEPPPPDEPDDGPDDDASPQVQRMAEAHLTEILKDEEDGLLRLATRHSRASKSWRNAVGGFYGNFAHRIADKGLCPLDKAREWCAARRDLVLENSGLFKRAENTLASDEALLTIGGTE